MFLNNLKKEILNTKGEPISEKTINVDTMLSIIKSGRSIESIISDLEQMKEAGEKVTLKTVLERSSLFQKNDKEQKLDDVVNRYRLFQKISQADDTVELSVDDIKTLKDNTAKSHTILVAGQVIESLECIGQRK